MVKQYATSHEAKINKHCKVQFNKTEEGELHVKLITFGKQNVVITEDTFNEVQAIYERYKSENISA